MLSQLYSLAGVLSDAGEILEAGPWLFVLANLLSSAPPPSEKRAAASPRARRFHLSAESLTEAANRCGLKFSRGMITAQVSETLEWRAAEAVRVGEPVYRPIGPDKIGRILGVTDEARREARAWNIGTFDGDQKSRREAYAQREIERMRLKRAKSGARPRKSSLSQTKPWLDLGVSRSKFYQLKAEGKLIETGAKKSAWTNSSQPISVDKFVADKFVATNKGSPDKFVATNKGNNRGVSSASRLEPIALLAEIAADTETVDGVATIDRGPDFRPAQPYTMADVKPGGLAARALAAMSRTAPPRDYEAENRWTLEQRRRRERAKSAS